MYMYMYIRTLTGGSGFLGWASLARSLGTLLDLWCGPGFSHVFLGLLGSVSLMSIVLFGWDWDLVEGLGLCLALGLVLGCKGVLRLVGGVAGGVWWDGLDLCEIFGFSVEGDTPLVLWAFPFFGMVPVECPWSELQRETEFVIWCDSNINWHVHL